MNELYLKYYLQENPNYGKLKPPFVPPTNSEYQEYLQSDSGGICGCYNSGNLCSTSHISSYERYVEREKHHYEIPDEKLVLCQCIVDSEDVIKKIESKQGFIRWI
jgi:hypothetical protein